MRTVLFLLFIYGSEAIHSGMNNRTLHPQVSISWGGNLTESYIPVMKIHYILSKATREVALTRRSPFGKISIINDFCSFRGTMKGTKHATVTVTGCPDEEFQVMVHTKSQKAVLATVEDGVTYTTPVIDRSSNDVLIKDPDDVDHIANAAGFGKRKVPKKLYIRLAVAIDETFKDYFDNDIDKSIKIINQIMLHVEGVFKDGSLGTEVEFLEMSLYDHSEVSSIGAASEDNLNLLGPYAEEYNKAAFFNHFVLFSYDANGDDVVGMSYIGKICSDESSSRISIAEYDKSPVHTAMIFAHELGHNLGLAHDAGVCVGIMYPLIIGAESWSDCSKLQLKGYYNKVLNKVPFFCLEEGSGSWGSWSKWSDCDSECKKKRTRTCGRNICAGEGEEEKDCDLCSSKLMVSSGSSGTNPKIVPTTQNISTKQESEAKNHLISLLFGDKLPLDKARDLHSRFNPFRHLL